MVEKTAESGLYLAASSYTGATGCQGFLVSQNIVTQACNNSYLIIGGRSNVITDNVCRSGFNTGIMCWHCCQTTVSGNKIEKCNSKDWSGKGTLGDAFAGGIWVDGDDAIYGSATYQCKLFDNHITECGQGRAAQNYAIRISNDAFSGAANKCYVGGNQTSDADVHFQNDQSVTVVDMETRQPDVTALQTAVTALEAYHPANPIRVVEPSANDEDVPVLASDTFLLIKHSEKTGLTATLPSNATNGSTVIIKNFQYGDGSNQDAFNNIEFKITVRPAQGQSPAHTIDYKFSYLELMANSLTSGDYAGENEACKLLYYHPDRTWLAVQDSY